jgi:hypothetical protein
MTTSVAGAVRYEEFAMSMIFPGMDPYLENPKLWPPMHSRMLVYMADKLQSLMGRRYITSVEERIYVEGPDREVIPDIWVSHWPGEIRAPRHHAGPAAVAVLEDDESLTFKVQGLEIHEPYITILDLLSGQRIVTMIEVVSPTNKYAGPGRKSYEMKQKEVLASDTHLVEIDLLRFGPHIVAVPEHGARGQAGAYDYLISLSRAGEPRDEYEFYPCRLRKRLPRIRIPLVANDPDVQLDLQAVLAHTYQAGNFRHRIDYRKPCVPPLPPDDQAWADQLIGQAGETSSE